MSNCIKDIEHLSVFDLLTEEEIIFLDKHKTTVSYKKNETILKQGTFASTILFGKSGYFKLHIEGKKKGIILAVKKSNAFLGLSSLYYVNKTYLYSVTALEDCEVDVYDKSIFLEVMHNNVSFSNEIIKYINHNSARIFNRFLCVAEKNARGRVADMLICFSRNIFERLEFTLVMTRQELSDFVGLSMENTVRILKEFEDDQIIKISGKKVEIIDMDVLQKIRDFG